MSGFDAARKIADAVLYEGYLLYPYTASAPKNQMRWQFGVLVPQASAEALSEPWFMQTEVLVEPKGKPAVDIMVRFLQLQSRIVEQGEEGNFVPVDALHIDGKNYISWDEAVPQEIRGSCELSAAQRTIQIPIDVSDSHEIEIMRDAGGAGRGRIIRQRWRLGGVVIVSQRRCGEFVKLRVRVENRSGLDIGKGPASAPAGQSAVPVENNRAVALRESFISTHALLQVQNGEFLSLLDPPAAAAGAATACENLNLWPVLVGAPGDKRSRTLMLASPIILYDYPETAVESEADKFDGTEIDELLNLSVLSMTDAEKQQARDTDEHARGVIDRAEAMAPEHFAKLHGVIRYLESAGRPAQADNGHGEGPAGALEDEVPGSSHVVVRGKKVVKGSRVRLRPVRRADVWDVFLAGRTALVAGVFEDLEDQRYVAVTVDDDPASDMHDWYGRYFYFYPDEIEPLESLP